MNTDIQKEIIALMNIIKAKNVEIKDLREQMRTYDSVNLILAAYVAILTKKKGRTVIAKKAISEALGKYLVNAQAVGDVYVITVRVEGEDSEGFGLEASCAAE